MQKSTRRKKRLTNCDFYIGGIPIRGQAVLAPMAGITDSAYRQICKRFGAALVISELISCDGLIHQNPKGFKLLEFSESERPYSIQLFGGEPETIRTAAQIVAQYQPDFIDLNVGCPAPKVTKKHCGADLLRNLSLLFRIAEQLVNAVKIPITAKIRSGWDSSSINAVETVRGLQDVGVQAIAIHARTRTQGYRGSADWDVIRQAKAIATIPIIGNGDVASAEDAKRMIDQTNCDAVMIGRAIIGRPWLFQEINEFLQKETLSARQPTIAEVIDLCLEHLTLALKYKNERQAVIEMRKFFKPYTKDWPNGAMLRQQLMKTTQFSEVQDAFRLYQAVLNPENITCVSG